MVASLLISGTPYPTFKHAKTILYIHFAVLESIKKPLKYLKESLSKSEKKMERFNVQWIKASSFI